MHVYILGTKVTPNTIPNYSTHYFVIWSCIHGHSSYYADSIGAPVCNGGVRCITHQACKYGFADWVCRLPMHVRYPAESKEIDNIVGVLFTVVS